MMSPCIYVSGKKRISIIVYSDAKHCLELLLGNIFLKIKIYSKQKTSLLTKYHPLKSHVS